jgi:IS30 family transposase
MPKPYKQLTRSEREQMANLLPEGYSLGDIAKTFGRNKSTISRELGRNSPPERRRYTPCRAHARACKRKTTASTHYRLKNDFIRRYVKDGLEKGWSPEQISGRIRIDHPGNFINHEAIYQYIYHPQNPHAVSILARDELPFLDSHRLRPVIAIFASSLFQDTLLLTRFPFMIQLNTLLGSPGHQQTIF